MVIHKASFWEKAWPGLLVAVVLAVFATWLGKYISWLGGAGVGILSGVIIASLVQFPAVTKPGFTAAGKQILQTAVILIGAGLNLAAVWRTGLETLGLMACTISAVFLVAWFVGRKMGITANNRDLIASGTAICGGSAIAAVAPVIGAKDEEISYSISVVFLFNLAAVVIFPLLGQAMHMSPERFGIWAGTAVNDTSSVMAASFAYSAGSVPTATLVKMTRTIMIVPMALIFSFIAATRAKKDSVRSAGSFSFVKVFPWFVLGFLFMSLWTTWGGLSPEWASWFQAAGKFLIVVALSGIGLNTNIRKILATGTKPIILGLCLWFTVAALALILI
jgi:Predicted membrane protein